MKNKNIPENLLEGLNITEKRSGSTMIKALIYLVIGIAATLSLVFIKDSKSSMYMFMGIVAALGYIMAVCIVIFVRRSLDGGRKRYVDE